MSQLYPTACANTKTKCSEKHELTEQARQLIKVIRQLEASLDDTKARDDYDQEDGELKVTYPLLQCVEHLRSKHQTISKLHRERYEQIKSSLHEVICGCNTNYIIRTRRSATFIRLTPRIIIPPD